MMGKNKQALYKNQQGVGMVEVLVSLLLLAISVLGFVGLQSKAIKDTSVSATKTNGIIIIRELGEHVRVNYMQKAQFQSSIKTFNDAYVAGNPPSKPTGDNDCVTKVCPPANAARYDAYQITKKAYDNGMQIALVPCKKSDGSNYDAEVAMDCAIVSWNKTNPTFGTDDDPSNGSMDCVQNSGVYHPKSTCLIMELI